MKRRSAWVSCTIAAALATLPMAASAEEYRLDELRIDHPMARATPPGARTGLVFFTVDNAGDEADRLERASTPVAGGVSMHQMIVEGGMMKMRAVPSIEIRPGARIEFHPGGYHLMLLELKQPLVAGEKFPVTLTFARGGAVTVSVQVEAMGAMPGERR
jgi:periplasmic copper chaperone A